MTSEPETQLHLPAHGDILGTWLMSALTGKITYTEKSVKTGKEYGPGDAPVPGTYDVIPHGESLDGCMGRGGGCVYEVRLQWDQWVVCLITCEHGTYDGCSRYFNVTEAIIDAIGAFNEDDHPQGKMAEPEAKEPGT